MKVICDKVGDNGYCPRCPHGAPHEMERRDGECCGAVMACERTEVVCRCVPVGAEKEAEMEDMVALTEDEGTELDGAGDGVKDQEKGFEKKRKPYNYTLQKRSESLTDGWIDVKDGFVSPEAAVENVAKAKLVGTFRAVRVASDEYVSELTTPEPVLTVRKVKKEKAKARK